MNPEEPNPDDGHSKLFTRDGFLKPAGVLIKRMLEEAGDDLERGFSVADMEGFFQDDPAFLESLTKGKGKLRSELKRKGYLSSVSNGTFHLTPLASSLRDRLNNAIPAVVDGNDGDKPKKSRKSKKSSDNGSDIAETSEQARKRSRVSQDSHALEETQMSIAKALAQEEHLEKQMRENKALQARLIAEEERQLRRVIEAASAALANRSAAKAPAEVVQAAEALQAVSAAQTEAVSQETAVAEKVAIARVAVAEQVANAQAAAEETARAKAIAEAETEAESDDSDGDSDDDQEKEHVPPPAIGM